MNSSMSKSKGEAWSFVAPVLLDTVRFVRWGYGGASSAACVVTFSLAGGAEAAAGGIFLCSRDFSSRRMLFWQFVRSVATRVLNVFDISFLPSLSCHSTCEVGRPEVVAVGVAAHGACAVCSVNITLVHTFCE